MFKRLIAITVLAAASLAAFAGSSEAIAGGGGCRGMPVTSEAGILVRMEHSCFTPSVLHVEPGDRITWVNTDGLLHSVVGANGSWGSNTAIQPGQELSYTFENEGVYSYFCQQHVGMIGTIIVGDPKADPSEDTVAAADAGSTVAGAESGLPWTVVTASAGGVSALVLGTVGVALLARRRKMGVGE